MKRIAISVRVAAAAMVAVAWTRFQPDRTSQATRPAVIERDLVGKSAPVTQVSMQNVNFFMMPDAALRIRSLRGEMRPLRGGVVNFDDKASFVIRLAHAEVGLNGGDLSTLMNKAVFAYPGAPLKRMRVRTSGGQLVQSGILHKVVDLPFEITSEVSVTPDGLIQLHPTRTRILGVDGNGLMRAFGLSLESILDLRKAKGVMARGNDLFLDPTRMLPPPLIEGRLTGIRVEGDELVQTFGSPSAATALARPDTSATAFMFYKGGTLRFGKLLMLDAEMQIVRLDSRGRFGFDLDRYKQQLVAGYSRTLPNFGLEVFMPDIEGLSKPKSIAVRR